MSKFSVKKISLFTAAIALLIFFHLVKITAPVEAFIVDIFRPALKAAYLAGSFFHFDYVEQEEKTNLVNSVKLLQNEVAVLTAENAKLKILEEENRTLRGYLNFAVKNNFTLLPAGIISRGEPDVLHSGQTVIIDRGEKDGLSKGMVLITEGGMVAGKITAVKEEMAEACLVNGNDCKFAAAVSGKSKTSGVARGEMGLTVKMEFIPQTEEIKEGDTIVTSGLEKNITAGLVIGKVASVNKEANELWQEAALEPLADLADLKIVSVLVPTNN